MSTEFAVRLPEDLVETLVLRVVECLNAQPERRFFSKSALAEHLGVSPRTIKTWRERGLPGRKIGREVMFEINEVNLWLDREVGT